MPFSLSDEDARKIRELWNWFKSSERRRTPHFEKRRAIGGSGKCRSYWLIWIQSQYAPQSGSFDLAVATVNSANETTVTTVTVNYDETSETMAEKLRAIDDLVDGTGEAAEDRFSVVGGLPVSSLRIRNGATGGGRITAISDGGNNSLLRGWPHIDPFVFED